MADNLNNIGGPDAMFGDGSALLPEYEPYLIATIEQEGEGRRRKRRRILHLGE